MKPINGFTSELRKKGYEQLPAGPYVAKIVAVKLEGNEPDQTLILRLDVAEGPYTGYYTKRFQHDSQNDRSRYPAKYKGDFRLRVPNENNKRAQYPESDMANFKDFVAKIEESNPGYHWDWNEQGLRGLLIGINVQQGTYNGSAYTKIKFLEIVDEVRNGQVATLPPMEPRGDAWEPPVDQQSGMVMVNTDDVPFE